MEHYYIDISVLSQYSNLTQLQISQLHLFVTTELVTCHNITVIVQLFQIITKYFVINVSFTYFITL